MVVNYNTRPIPTVQLQPCFELVNSYIASYKYCSTEFCGEQTDAELKTHIVAFVSRIINSELIKRFDGQTFRIAKRTVSSDAGCSVCALIRVLCRRTVAYKWVLLNTA